MEEKKEVAEQKKEEPQKVKEGGEKTQATKKDETPPSSKEEKPKPAKAKGERQVCTKCGKKLKHKGWYYRDGKYYCNKRCWRQTKEKAEKPS